jgi:hypothetical protein
MPSLPSDKGEPAMSNVIAFPKRPTPTESEFKRFPPVTPWPAWKYALRDSYWMRTARAQ